MYGVFRHVTEGLVLKELATACEVNEKLRKCGDGYELLAVRDSLSGALERKREIRKKWKAEAEESANEST